MLPAFVGAATQLLFRSVLSICRDPSGVLSPPRGIRLFRDGDRIWPDRRGCGAMEQAQASVSPLSHSDLTEFVKIPYVVFPHNFTTQGGRLPLQRGDRPAQHRGGGGGGRRGGGGGQLRPRTRPHPARRNKKYNLDDNVYNHGQGKRNHRHFFFHLLQGLASAEKKKRRRRRREGPRPRKRAR